MAGSKPTGRHELPSGIVTAMFTDVVDSTRLKGAMSAETASRRDEMYRASVKTPHDKRILAHVRGAGGHKIKSTGDGFFFTFSDAEEAVLCALAIQDSLRAEPIDTPIGPLRLRIGLHTGMAQAAGQDYSGATIDKAARVQGSAEPGEVLLSGETRAIVAQLRNVKFEETSQVDLKGLGVTTLFRAMRHAANGDATPEAAQTAPDPPAFVNPYDFATTANGRTFKGRTTETEDLLDSIETCTHTVIFGLQRMGKTSLITQGLNAELDSRPALRKSILIATVDLQRLGGVQVTYRDFVHAIFESIVDSLAAMGLGREVQNMRMLTRDLFAASQYQRGDRTEFFSVFSKLLGTLSAASKRRIVLFIDEFSEIRKVIEKNKTVLQANPSRTTKLLPHDMYVDVPFINHLSSLLKDEALKQQITFVVLVRPFLSEYDEREGLQILKLMKPITLTHLDEVAAKELITRPVAPHLAYDDGVVDHLYTLTAGHPYLLQFILKLVVDKIKRTGHRTIHLADVEWVRDRMITDGPSYDAQFAVLISDYSVDEIMHRREAQLGKGLMALVAWLGQEQDGWVDATRIFGTFSNYKIPDEKTASLLSQLTRTRILEEEADGDVMRYRLSIPLVRDRFVKQNVFQKILGPAIRGV